MNFKETLVEQFKGRGSRRPLFMPDLGQWFEWHRRLGTLPDSESSLADIAFSLNCPAWMVHTPWRLEYDGIEVTREESEARRVIRYHTRRGVLSELWELGPDRDWWQKEYPVKDEDDLDAAEEIVKAMRYRLKASLPAEADADSGIVDAVQIPRTPYSNMLHSLLGWTEGLMLMMGPEEERLTEMLAVMEEKRNELIQKLAGDLPHSIFVAPDNLDGQFISPAVFENHLEASYRSVCQQLHQRGRYLMVHIGGISRHLLPLLAGCGIDILSGISGPPQSDAELSAAREATGPDITLWGGIPQDYVMPMHDLSVLIKSVEEAKAFAEIDGRTIIGVADHVPVDAEFSRLKQISDLVNS